MFEERWYQEEGATLIFNDVKDNKDCHPVGAAPTASGKSAIFCKTIDKILSHNPTENILVLSHVEEILEQDYDAYRDYFEWDDEAEDHMTFSQIGIYSSGLGRREIMKVTVAGIQSVWRKPELFKHFGIIIIDECHLINHKQVGMYRTFLEEIDANYIGLTATPFRTAGGYIYKGENALFNKLSFDYTTMENFNRLTDEGYLAKIYSKETALLMSTEGVKTVAGEFSQKQLSEKLDREEITVAALMETIQFAKDCNRKKWMISAIDIKHCNNIVRILKELGEDSCIAIHSKMEGDRKREVRKFKSGKYKIAVFVGILTTGFNDPLVDLIALMRPTKSPVLHIQIPGRGLRPHPDKDYCAILDFAGNFSRMGPINDVKIREPGEKKKGGGPMVKTCEHCKTQNHLSALVCIECGEEFLRKEKLQSKSSKAEVVRETKPKKEKKPIEWYDIDSINFSVGTNKIGDSIFIIKYGSGMDEFWEIISLDGKGYTKHMANFWVDQHWIENDIIDRPRTVKQLRKYANTLRIPSRLKIDLNGKYPHYVVRKLQFQT